MRIASAALWLEAKWRYAESQGLRNGRFDRDSYRGRFHCIGAIAQNLPFHNAPPSTKEMTNPDAGVSKAAAAGRPLYHLRCARCHGERGEGSGNIPSIARGKVQSVSDGELFWFITKGDVPNGMPSWANLPKQQRWHIISYVKNLENAKNAVVTSESANEASSNLPAPKPPFTDYRFEKPGNIRKITLNDLQLRFLRHPPATARNWWLVRMERGRKFPKDFTWSCTRRAR